MNELAHEGQLIPINEHEDMVAYASVDTLVDELEKRFPIAIVALRDDDGDTRITWGGRKFDNDYAIALCERIKTALTEEDRQQNAIFFFEDEDEDDDGDLEDDEEYTVEE